ncbi:homoserine/homoserine lactone efflux protein [Pseudovibrio axinellae]|uniref:Homoserine/homoserine lactone efflux protein n=1 Tax=Pseudovibrio axinellae TaxID=989403 RepID=A0A165U1V8_9HYPH|nr:LysE family transporter [Pseudovibrio axinellae]KZL09457.1 homoserine/homoserine lactone efflux protein [Pseudovibrio axinellae]SEQ64293.1 Threonine/homoserine/homoserine lactone efflux protein [Pseudovibrio axinellae]
MDWATLSAFAIFVAIMTGTPGPGNLTFMAIGASAGYRTAFPVIIASQIGSVVLNIFVAFGLGQLMARGGPLVTVFKFASMAYMTYLAWRIVQLSIKPKGEVTLPTFWEGLLIHPLSPKTWAMSLVAFTSFFAANGLGLLENTAVLTAGFLLGGLISHSMWAMVGVSILKVIGEGALMRGITIAMALAMLAATAWSLLL